MAIKQRMQATLVDQFGNPHGVLGRVVAVVLTRRSSNRVRNEWAVEQLGVHDGDRVLEIGFGAGLAVAVMARRVGSGAVVGIDRSELMVRQATRRNVAAVREGRVQLRHASVEDVTAADGLFDKVLAVNSVLFWDDPHKGLVQLRDAVRPGGSVALVMQPRCPGANAETARRAAGDLEVLLDGAGFETRPAATLDLDPPVVCVVGVNPTPD